MLRSLIFVSLIATGVVGVSQASLDSLIELWKGSEPSVTRAFQSLKSDLSKKPFPKMENEEERAFFCKGIQSKSWVLVTAFEEKLRTSNELITHLLGLYADQLIHIKEYHDLILENEKTIQERYKLINSVRGLEDFYKDQPPCLPSMAEYSLALLRRQCDEAMGELQGVISSFKDILCRVVFIGIEEKVLISFCGSVRLILQRLSVSSQKESQSFGPLLRYVLEQCSRHEYHMVKQREMLIRQTEILGKIDKALNLAEKAQSLCVFWASSTVKGSSAKCS